jgi:phosphoesterase RecJ-like protein
MVDFLKGYGKRPLVYVSEPVPAQYHHLPHLDRCTDDIRVFEDAAIDLVVVFDCSDETYVKRLVELIPVQPLVINIDHHKTNTRYGDINQVIETAPATAQVVHGFFEANHLLPGRDAATCMLMGICFDTGAFSNAATNDQSLQIASSLVLLGGRIQDVIRSMFHNRSVTALRVWGLALERLHENPMFGGLTTCITRRDMEEHEVIDDEIDGLSNFLSLVTDTDYVAVARETKEGGVKVSMRSQGRDVSVLARERGGGGHRRAAGYHLPESRLVCDAQGCWGVEKTSNMR